MFIETQETPNENSLKFLPGCDVLTCDETYFFEKGKPIGSPLAREILEFCESILLGRDFITVTKHPSESWDIIKPLVCDLIVEHFENGLDILDKGYVESQDSLYAEDDPIIRQIRAILDTKVRPAVAQDGGDIIFDSFKEGVVYLKMQGACSGCPKSTLTLKNGIENMLKHYVPEVQEVKAVYG